MAFHTYPILDHVTSAASSNATVRKGDLTCISLVDTEQVCGCHPRLQCLIYVCMDADREG